MDRSRKSKNKKKLIKDYIAVIPARGGSKRIPRKRLMIFGSNFSRLREIVTKRTVARV